MSPECLFKCYKVEYSQGHQHSQTVKEVRPAGTTSSSPVRLFYLVVYPAQVTGRFQWQWRDGGELCTGLLTFLYLDYTLDSVRERRGGA